MLTCLWYSDLQRASGRNRSFVILKMAGDDRALVKKEGGNRRERREKEKKGKASGVDNTFRRTWDKDEYTEKAEARDKVGLSARSSPVSAVFSLPLSCMRF